MQEKTRINKLIIENKDKKLKKLKAIKKHNNNNKKIGK